MKEKENETGKTPPYIAVKLQGLSHWIWFKIENVTESQGMFVGKDGWGRGGEFTEIDIPDCMIEGRLVSDALQYNYN